MRYNKQQLIIVTIVVAVLLVPAIIWIGLGYAGNSSSAKMPAISTIGPEMNPYVLTALEKEKRLLPVTTPSSPMANQPPRTPTSIFQTRLLKSLPPIRTSILPDAGRSLIKCKTDPAAAPGNRGFAEGSSRTPA